MNKLINLSKEEIILPSQQTFKEFKVKYNQKIVKKKN